MVYVWFLICLFLCSIVCLLLQNNVPLLVANKDFRIYMYIGLHAAVYSAIGRTNYQ